MLVWQRQLQRSSGTLPATLDSACRSVCRRPALAPVPRRRTAVSVLAFNVAAPQQEEEQAAKPGPAVASGAVVYTNGAFHKYMVPGTSPSGPDWTGFIGHWFRGYSLDGPGEALGTVQRSFRWEEQETVLHQQNVCATQMYGFGPRPQDKLYAKNFFYLWPAAHARTANEPYEIVDPEDLANNVMSKYRQNGSAMLAPTADACACVDSRLPYVDGYSFDYWSPELFIKDGPSGRMSIVPLYKVEDGSLVFWQMAQEYHTTADPSSGSVLEAGQHLLKPTRPVMDKDPKSWLPAGARGTRTRLVVDNSARRVLIEPPATAAWAPPDAASYPANALCPLPDQMYIFTPANIKDAWQGQGEVRMEFGVRPRERPGSLCRLICNYSCVTGSIIDAVYEMYDGQ